MFGGHHITPKPPGSEVITWTCKQMLVGANRTGRLGKKNVNSETLGEQIWQKNYDKF